VDNLSSSSERSWALGPANLPFVGREAALLATEDAFRQATEGVGQIVLLSGEPGIGKTRMAEQVSAIARARGALVAWGSCHEWEGAPAYWPWTQVLRTCWQWQSPDDRPQLSPLQRALLGQILPELLDQEFGPDRPIPLGPEARRYQLLVATSALVRGVVSQQPLVIVLDDIHWADIPSLQLLRFLAIDMRNAPVLIIATYRDAEIGPRHPAASIITDLAREPHCLRLSLHGLTKQQVARFMEMIAGTRQPASLVDVIFEETAGNPFFVTEVVRLLADENSLDASEVGASRLQVPESVRGAIRRRVDRLSPDCRHILTVASVAGRDLDVRVLAHVTGISALELLDVLDEAARAQLIVPADGSVMFRFSHALVQQTLYQEIVASERVRLHLAIGAALEARGDREPPFEELAYHYVQAGPFGDPAKTLQYAEHAGHLAMSQFAWEMAATQYLHALDALELTNPADAVQRGDLLLALGDAENRSGPGSGDAPAARVRFLEAFDLASTRGDYQAMAQAAIGFAGLNIVTAFGEEEQRELLERALAALPPEASPLRVRVLSRLAVDLWNRSTENLMRVRVLADEAVEAATQLHDAGLHAFALWARHYSAWRPDNLRERMEISTRLVAFAEQTGDPIVTAWAYFSRTLDSIEAADLNDAEQSVAVVRHFDERVHISYVALREAAYHGMLSLVTGDYADAETHIERARDLWQSSTARQHQLQTFVLLRDTGRLDQLTEEISLPSSSNLWRVATEAHRMWSLLDREQLPEARRAYDALVADDFAHVPFDAYWYGVMIPLAEAAITFQDEPRMQRIYDLLSPYDDRLASVGILGVVHGPVSYTLGRLALELEEVDTAEQRLADALALSDERGLRPYVARGLVALAEVALRRGSARDLKKAHAYARRAADVADTIGMSGLVPRNEDLRVVFKAQRASKFGLTSRELDVLRLVAEGLTDQEVAERLFLSPRTVGTHLTSIYTRLNVSSRTAAARIALEYRLV
jgi:DNA-binding CsgD family transcriptional regulator